MSLLLWSELLLLSDEGIHCLFVGTVPSGGKDCQRVDTGLGAHQQAEKD